MTSESVETQSAQATPEVKDSAGSGWGELRLFLRDTVPRAETLILLLSLACIMLGKAIVLRGDTPPGGFFDIIQVILPDMVFFAAVFLLYQGLYEWKASVWTARLVLLLSFLI